jgi:ribosomal protein S3AE
LHESNQQILVINTTCVDGSVVFIDPISFSVLKKIKFNYQDYEVPKAVQNSIRQLRTIFDRIQDSQGKTVNDIFADLINKETQEVKIRDFVSKLLRMDPSLNEDKLYQTTRALDADGSGTITIDEFLEFFGAVQEIEAQNIEDDLNDDIWP